MKISKFVIGRRSPGRCYGLEKLYSPLTALRADATKEQASSKKKLNSAETRV